ncbi:MAG: hypothetical protein HUU31_23505 [Anaerolineae bacterium]|nr:hypothetical protein [Anaerolineae bacterium]
MLRETVLALREQGRSYRQIAREVGIHWTQVGQIAKSAEYPNADRPEGH